MRALYNTPHDSKNRRMKSLRLASLLRCCVPRRSCGADGPASVATIVSGGTVVTVDGRETHLQPRRSGHRWDDYCRGWSRSRYRRALSRPRIKSTLPVPSSSPV